MIEKNIRVIFKHGFIFMKIGYVVRKVEMISMDKIQTLSPKGKSA